MPDKTAVTDYLDSLIRDGMPISDIQDHIRGLVDEYVKEGKQAKMKQVAATAVAALIPKGNVRLPREDVILLLEAILMDNYTPYWPGWLRLLEQIRKHDFDKLSSPSE